MEVTRKNFNDVIPEIKKAIDESTFIAIDTELTGLYSSKSTEHAFDTMEERYVKIRELCSQFLITQFGVSIFKFHPQEKKYTHQDYNFYVFPPSNLKQGPDIRFLCQTSSLHFLASYKFDFNKVIYEGIPYLRPDQEEEVKEFYSHKYSMEKSALESAKSNVSTSVDIPDEHKEFISNILEQIDSFLKDNTQTEMLLEPCSAYQRKLIYDSVAARQIHGIDLSSKISKDKKKYIHIIKCTGNKKMEMLAERERKDMEEIETAVGFRKVLEYISESKKLVVGHHMYLDILHIIEQFFFPIPENLKDFKEMCNIIFPYLLDTKYLSTAEKIKSFFESNSVGNLFQDVQGKAFNLPPIDLDCNFDGYDLTSDKPHDAAYDAFMCGCVFIGLSRKLNSSKDDHVQTSSKVLSPFVNRFYIFRHHDIQSVNLCGKDPEPNRDHVFHVCFPKEWKTIDLVELFLPYGYIFVHWLNNASAFVALKKKENFINVRNVLLKTSNKLYQIKTYAEFQKSHLLKPENVQSNDSKRKNNNASESKYPLTCGMEKIPEDDEIEIEQADKSELPPAKKLKQAGDSNQPSLEKTEASISHVFDEENNW